MLWLLRSSHSLLLSCERASALACSTSLIRIRTTAGKGGAGLSGASFSAGVVSTCRAASDKRLRRDEMPISAIVKDCIYTVLPCMGMICDYLGSPMVGSLVTDFKQLLSNLHVRAGARSTLACAGFASRRFLFTPVAKLRRFLTETTT